MHSMQLYLLDNHANILSAFINEKWHVHLVQNYQLMDTSNLVRLFTVSLWKWESLDIHERPRKKH